MKKLLLLILTGLMVVCGIGYGIHVSRSPASPVPQAALMAIPSQVEVSGKTGNSVNSEFKLHNTGTLPVVIDRLETSCHCTTIESLDTHKLAPNESAIVRLKLNPPSTGQQSAVVTVYVSEPAPFEVRIPVRMQGQEIHPPFIRSMPYSVHRELDGTEELPVEFEFRTVEHPGEAWVTAMASSTKHIVSKELTPRTEHEYQDFSGNASSVLRIYNCRLKLKPLSPGQSIRGFLRPQCRSESQKPIPSITVMVDYPATIKVFPSEVFVSAKEAQSSKIERKMIIECQKEGLLSNLQVTCSADWMTTEVTQRSSTITEIQLRITPPASKVGGSPLQLTFQFCDDSLSAIVVPIVFE